MHIAMIGNGAIGRFVRERALALGHDVGVLLVRPERLDAYRTTLPNLNCVAAVSDLPANIEHVIDCAGHGALKNFGPGILRRGVDLTTVSLGALADASLYADLAKAAQDGNARLHLASGAIGALDCLRAARVGGLTCVTYVGRKPPRGWIGSPAEQSLDLKRLSGPAQTHFEGTAREAALAYPKNANVAAAVALAGVGFDATRVELIADPDIAENIHEIRADGAFGRFTFTVNGRSLPDNPRSSALAAMSVIAKLEQHAEHIVIG